MTACDPVRGSDFFSSYSVLSRLILNTESLDHELIE